MKSDMRPRLPGPFTFGKMDTEVASQFEMETMLWLKCLMSIAVTFILISRIDDTLNQVKQYFNTLMFSKYEVLECNLTKRQLGNYFRKQQSMDLLTVHTHLF